MRLKPNYPRSGPLGMINGNTMPTTPQKPVKIKIGKAAAPMITVLAYMLKRQKYIEMINQTSRLWVIINDPRPTTFTHK